MDRVGIKEHTLRESIGVTDESYERDTLYAKCPECDNTWDVEGYNEVGVFHPDKKDDMYCPHCGVESD